jgi:hypothetical protein
MAMAANAPASAIARRMNRPRLTGTEKGPTRDGGGGITVDAALPVVAGGSMDDVDGSRGEF